MARFLLTASLLLCCVASFALSSTTNSALFTLDTVAPSLALIAPNGGEQWYLGDTNDILWTATDTNLIDDSVFLWYSLNGGIYYTILAEGIANSGYYPWLMPNQTTNQGRVRIRVEDGFGNLTQISSAGTFTIPYVPPAAPEGITVDITNSVDAVITWEPVTQTIYGTPITPDGYIVLYNESPYENNDHFYYFLWNVTSGTSFTHPDVARFRDQMYYRVVAYIDYDGRMAGILADAKADPERKLSFAEIRELMNGGAK